MNTDQQDIEIGLKDMETRGQRQFRILIILIATTIIFFVFGSIAFVQRNSALQQASTAQADNVIAVAKQETAQAASTIAIAKQGTVQANAEKSQIQAQISRANEIAAQSLVMQDKNFPVSMLLGLESYSKHNTSQSTSILLENTRANPHLQQYLSGHKNAVSTVLFSPDGDMVASTSCLPTVRYRCEEAKIILHDSHTGQIIKSLMTHTDNIRSLAFSPDGNILAAGSLNATTLWDVKTGQPIGSPLTTDDALLINAVAFSPDGSMLASTGCSRTDMGTCVSWNIKLWNVKNGQLVGEPFIGEPIENTNIITGVTFSPDGNTLAAISYLGTIFILDIKNHQIHETLTTGQSDGRIQFIPNGNLISRGMNGSSFTVKVWDLETQQLVGEPLQTTYDGNIGAISPDGSVFAQSAQNALIFLYDLKTHERNLFGEGVIGDTTLFDVQAFSPDGTTLALIGQDKSTIILARKAEHLYPIGKTLVKSGPEHYAWSIVFSPDGQVLAVGGRDTVSLWDVKTGRQTGKTMPAPYTGDIAFNPNGTVLASGTCVWKHGYTCQQAGIILWDIKTNQPVGEPLTSEDGLFVGSDSVNISSLAFSPDGRILASGSMGSANNVILLWDTNTGKLVGKPLEGHTSSISKVVFNPDGTMLASSSFDHTIMLWDVKTGQAIVTLTGHKDVVESVAFSPDGNTLASASLDSSIILWDVKSKQPIGEPLKPNLIYTYDVAFSPDGKTLASAGSVSSVVLWDLETRQPIGEPMVKSLGGGLGGMSIAFSPDGNMLASTHSNFSDLILWNVNPQSWIYMTCQRVGRNFTRTEWEKYFPGEEYRATCPQWPLEEVSTPVP